MENPPNRPIARRPDGLSRRVVKLPPTARQVNMQAVMPSPAAPAFAYKAEPKRRLRMTPKWKRALKIGGSLLAAVVVVLVIQLVVALTKVITKNFTGIAPALSGDTTKLKGEGDGRVNILLLGIDDTAGLSDTVMVASIDPRTKDVAMLSIPRDLWVPIPGFNSNKINAAHAFGEQNKKKVAGGGPALAKETVSKMLDLPIHYFVRIDFAGFRKAIDAVGGIDVYVDSALNDPEYPCDRNPYLSCGFKLSAGHHHMDGALALKYARCRKGTCGSDFGRAERQQKVLLALRQKGMDLNTLTNPAKLSSLIAAVGDHLKTDFQPNEIKKLALIAKDVDPAKVTSKVLDDSEDGLLVSHHGDYRGSILLPRSGNFDEIRAFAHSIFVDGYLKEEGATIEVQNGTNRANLATTIGKLLKGYNYNVLKTTTADQKYAATVIYDYTGGKKPVTVQYLEKRFGVKVQRASVQNPDTDIKIILGANFKGLTE